MALIGWPELILILAIILLLFGASRLTGLGKALGESVREFKKAMAGPEPPSKTKGDEEAIIEAARKMGIETEGKSIKEILDEMAKKAEEKG